MKKLLLLPLIIALCSCAKYSQQRYIYDFREYSKEGFVITPTSTGFDYEPIGEIEMTFTPGARKGYQDYADKKSTGDALYNSSSATGNWFDPSPDYMLKEFVEYAKSLGATGMLEFKATAVTKGDGKVIHYRLSAFAVKIENPIKKEG